jgi:peptide/nickel transport system substrate-binding protein
MNQDDEDPSTSSNGDDDNPPARQVNNETSPSDSDSSNEAEPDGPQEENDTGPVPDSPNEEEKEVGDESSPLHVATVSSEPPDSPNEEDNPPDDEAIVGTPAKTSEPVIAGEPNPRKTKNGLKILIAIIVIIIIALVVGYLIHKHNQNQSAPNGEKTVSHITLGIEEGDLGSTFYPNAVALAGSSLMYTQVFDGLVQYENQNQLVPDLASGWTTPNDTTWLFTIKSGIKFHDGHTLTASDVAYSLNLLRKMASGNNSYAQEFAYTLKSVQTVGSNQVKIITTQPDPVLLNKLNFLYIVDPNLPKGDDPSMAGTGAYELKTGTKLTDGNVQLTAFNDFHGGPVLTKSLTIDDVKNNNTLLSGFKSHIYNIIGEVPNADVDQSNSFKFTEQDDTVTFLGFNTTNGPLNNILVREAIRYALNPTKLSSEYQVTPISQLIPPAIPGYNPSITPYQQNVTKSKQLLAQAGYSKGLSLNLSDVSGNAFDQQLVSQLKQVGINITIKGYPNFNDLLICHMPVAR